MLSFTDKEIAFLIALVPTRINADIIGSELNASGGIDALYGDNGRVIPYPIPLTAPLESVTKYTGFIELNHTVTDTIPTANVTSALARGVSTGLDFEISTSTGDTITYGTKGVGGLNLNILSTRKNKLDFVFDALIEYASSNILKVRFIYIGMGSFKPRLILQNRVKTVQNGNANYNLVFTQPQRGVQTAVPKTSSPSFLGVF